MYFLKKNFTFYKFGNNKFGMLVIAEIDHVRDTFLYISRCLLCKRVMNGLSLYLDKKMDVKFNGTLEMGANIKGSKVCLE